MTRKKSKKNFNSYCTQIGREFEDAVICHEAQAYDSILLSRDTLIPGTGVEVDAIFSVPLSDKSGSYTQTLTKYIQAKGGKPGEGKKPGAQRTDSVKKAIAEGSLIKTVMPDSWFTVYFSERPKAGSHSDLMINAALKAGLLNEVKYIEYPN